MDLTGVWFGFMGGVWLGLIFLVWQYWRDGKDIRALEQENRWLRDKLTKARFSTHT